MENHNGLTGALKISVTGALKSTQRYSARVQNERTLVGNRSEEVRR